MLWEISFLHSPFHNPCINTPMIVLWTINAKWKQLLLSLSVSRVRAGAYEAAKVSDNEQSCMMAGDIAKKGALALCSPQELYYILVHSTCNTLQPLCVGYVLRVVVIQRHIQYPIHRYWVDHNEAWSIQSYHCTSIGCFKWPVLHSSNCYTRECLCTHAWTVMWLDLRKWNTCGISHSRFQDCWKSSLKRWESIQ